MPVDSLIVGVDLVPIKPIPKVITFQSDITTEKCRSAILHHLKTWKADTVLHDGAPNVGTAWVQDSYNQAELAHQAMKLATEFLIEGGTFVTKVFRSKDYNSLLWVFNQLFTKVEATKPPSSRNVSAEIFVVCRGFKAPKHIDPRFLDPRSVFAELRDPAPNNEAKVYKPEAKKRKREGYEEGNVLQFKKIAASEFIQTTDPITILGGHNELSFEQVGSGDVALTALNKLPETTDAIREACTDLKVLGRKEFKMLLKWRLKVRDIFGFPSNKNARQEMADEEVTRVEDMDEEVKIQEEFEAMKERNRAKKKRERKKENVEKRKNIIRMQLGMTADMSIGMDHAGPMGADSIFALKSVENVGSKRFVNGKMVILTERDSKQQDSGIGIDSDESSEEDGDNLEGQLDRMYADWKERKAAADAKYRAKMARTEHGDEEWEGISGGEKEEESDSEDLEEDSDSGFEDEGAPAKLIADLEDSKPTNGLSQRAASFFSRDIFKDLDGIYHELGEEGGVEDEVDQEEDEDEEIERHLDQLEGNSDDAIPSVQEQRALRQQNARSIFEVSDASDDDKMEIVERDHDEWKDENSRPDGTINIDIVTAEAMTLAHQLASREKTRTQVIDDGFNKYAFRDKDGLPDWFIEDEAKHSKPQQPISKAAAQAIKDKLRALNARPIKKVREAKARKKFRAAQRLEKLRKKSDLIAAEESMTEKDKAESIQRMLSKAARAKPRKETRLVIARGINKGIRGRPTGVRGRYKIVDRRLKKDVRGLKRAAAKAKKR